MRTARTLWIVCLAGGLWSQSLMAQMFRGSMARTSQPQTGGGKVQEAYSSVKIAVDERTNSLIVIGSAENLELISELVKDLEENPAETILQIKIYPLENADANTLAQTVRELFDEQSSTSGRGSSQQSTSSRFRMAMSGGRSSSRTSSRQGEDEPVKVSVDERTNSLIVVATKEKIDLITQLVEQLDADETEVEATMTYKCKFGNAVNIANVINDLFADENQRSRTNRTATRGARGTTTTRSTSPNRTSRFNAGTSRR